MIKFLNYNIKVTMKIELDNEEINFILNLLRNVTVSAFEVESMRLIQLVQSVKSKLVMENK